MTAKEYLGQAFISEGEIRVRQSELEAMRSALHGRGINYEGIGGQPADNELEKAICRVVDREKELNREIVKLLALKNDISKAIRKVPSARHKELLVRRYLDFERWEHIAMHMGVEVRTIFYLHKNALGSFSRVNASLLKKK